MESPIKVYGHAGCFMVPGVLRILDRSGAAYEYVDIHADVEAREHVRTINQGYESVPTLVFPDGGTLTEPSGRELRQRLLARGYVVEKPGWEKLLDRFVAYFR